MEKLATDPVIEAYKVDVDRTLLRENLRLTVSERIDRLQELLEDALALRAAMTRARGASGRPRCGSSR